MNKNSNNSENNNSQRDNVTVRLLAETDACGGLIGKSGGNIKEIRQRSSAKIYINTKDVSAPRSTIEISGEKENVKMAVMLIVDRLDEVYKNRRNENVNRVELNFLVSYQQAGAIIGNSGANFKRIRTESGVFFRVEKETLPRCDEKLATLRGSCENVKKAAEIVLEIYFECYNADLIRSLILFRPEFDKRTPMPIEEPFHRSPYVPRDGFDYPGEREPQIHQDFPIHPNDRYQNPPANFDNRRDPYRAHPRDLHDLPPKGLSRPTDNYIDRQGEFDPIYPPKKRLIPYPKGEEVTVIYPVNKGLIGAIIGRRGKHIMRIRKETGVTIKVEKEEADARRVEVTISGSKNRVRDALIDIEWQLYNQ